MWGNFFCALLAVFVFATHGASRVSLKKLSTYGAPAAQEGSSCHFLLSNGEHKLFLLGGRTSPTSWNKDFVSLFHPATKKWTSEVFRGTDPKYARSHHSSVVYNNKVYIFGGRVNEVEVSNDLLVVDPEAKTITLIHNSKGTPPAPRERHAAIAVGSKMIIVGGHNLDGITFDDTVIYDMATNTWESKRPVGTPGRRSGHKLATKGSRYVYAIGGREVTSNTFHTDIAELDVEKMTWSVFPTEKFDPRTDFTATAVGDILWIVGGFNKDIKLDDVKAWDIHNDKWLDVLVSGAIQRRLGHCAAADVSGLYIFGGQTAYWKMLNDLYFLETGPSAGATVVSPAAAPAKGGILSRIRSSVHVTLEDRSDVISTLKKLLADSEGIKDMEALKNAVFICNELGPKAEAVEDAKAKLERSRRDVADSLNTATTLGGLLDNDNQTDIDLNAKLEEQQVALSKIRRQFQEDETRHTEHTRRVSQLQDALGRFRDQQEIARTRKESKIKEIAALKARLAAAEKVVADSDRALQSLKKENKSRGDVVEKHLANLLKKQKEAQDCRETLEDLQGQYDGLVSNRSDIELRIQKIQSTLDKADKVRGAVDGAELAAQSATSLSQRWVAEAEEEVDVMNTYVACENHVGYKTIVKRLEEKLARLRKELDGSWSTYKGLSGRIQKERERLADLTTKEQELIYILDDARLHLQRIQAELSALEKKHLYDQQQLQGVKDELSRAEAGLKELNDIYDSKKQLAEEQEAKLKEDESAYRSYHERYASTQKIITKYEADIASLQGQLDRHRSQRDERMQNFAALKKNLSTIMAGHQASWQRFRSEFEKATHSLSMLTLCKEERAVNERASQDHLLVTAQQGLLEQTAKLSALYERAAYVEGENKNLAAEVVELKRKLADVQSDHRACRSALEITERK